MQRNLRSNCQQPLDHRKSKGIPEKCLLLLYWRPLTMWITTNCGKFFKRWEYQTTWPASWEICMQIKRQVRTGHGTTDWLQIRTGVCQGCILSHCLFNLYAEYIKWNVGLDDSQAEIKIAGRNSNSFRYADVTLYWQKGKGKVKGKRK